MLITFPMGLHVQICNGLALQQGNHKALCKLSKEEYTLKTFDVATFDKVNTTMVMIMLDDPTGCAQFVVTDL